MNRINKGAIKSYLTASPFRTRVLISIALVFVSSTLIRTAPALAFLLIFAAGASVVWMVIGAFKSSEKFKEAGSKTRPRFLRIVGLFIAVPPLFLVSLAAGAGIGLSIKPYSAQELAQQQLAEEIRNQNAKAPGTQAGDDYSEVQTLIQTEFPNCQFEDLRVDTDKLYPFTDDMTNRVWMTHTVSEMNFLYQKDSAGKDNLDVPSEGVSFKGHSKSLDYRVCNTKGRGLVELDADNSYFGSSLKDVTGKDYCWIPGRAPTTAEKKLLTACQARIETQSRLGFWIGVHSFPSDSEAKSVVLPLAEKQWEYGWGSFPLLFVKNIVIFAVGPFDEVNQATVDELDLAWQRIATQTKAKNVADVATGNEFMADYPTSFDRNKWPKFQTKAGEGSRVQIAQAYEKLSRYLTCNNSLVLSELDFNVGACGKQKVEVFQADLNTGECSFLGYWTDSNGKEKIGVFEFCSAYEAGSFKESKTYNLKLRISGTTSYSTKLGYQNQVVTFSVIN